MIFILKQTLSVLVIVAAVSWVTTDEAGRPKTAAQLGIMQGFPVPSDRLVTRNNWDTGPFNRWAFQHISDILPTANISRSSGPVTEFPRVLSDLSRLIFKNYDGENMTVKEMLDETYTDGFIVLMDGAVVFEKYFNGMTPATKHLLMSVSKSVTGTLAGTLVDDGRLKPEAKVTDYIPELQNSAYTDATVRQVLDMTVSVIYSEEYGNPDAEVTTHEKAMGWRLRTELSQAGTYAFLQTLKKDNREHGKIFHYSSANTDVLGWLIERASNQRFADFFSQRIWSKLGAEHDAYITVDERGSAVPNGGMCMTLRDLARFAQMMLQDGYLNGKQIVSPGWVDDCRNFGSHEAWKPSKYSDYYPNGFYRNQWYNTKNDHDSYFAVGVHGQHIWIDPTTRVVIVKFSSQPKAVELKYIFDTFTAFEAIARSLAE